MASIPPKQLPRLVEHMADELPASYIARLAWANGCKSAHMFRRVMALPAKTLTSPSVDAVRRLALWTGTGEVSLRRFSLLSDAILPFGGDLVKRSQLFGKGVKYCPHCLASDAERTGEIRPQYIRGSWQWKMISHCSVHGTMLENYPLGIEHLTSFSELKASPDQDYDPHPCDAYFTGRLAAVDFLADQDPEPGSNKDGSTSDDAGLAFLNQVPAYVAAEVCALLGHFVISNETGKLTERIKDGFTNHYARRKGFEIACQGRDAVWDYLAAFVAKAAKRLYGARSVYSPFLYWWKVNKHDPNYLPMMRFFQDHAENHISFEPGEVFIWPITKRKVHTVATAALEYDISQERVRLALAARMGTEDVPRYFSREMVHPWLLEAAAYVTTSQAAETVGCSMKIMDDLIKADLIGIVPNREYDGRVYRLVHKSEIERFLRMLKEVIDRDLEPSGLTPTADIHRLCNMRLVKILKLAFDGHIKRVTLQGATLSLGGLLFDRDEIIAACSETQTTNPAKPLEPDFIDINAARRRLRVTKSTVEELVRCGFLSTRDEEYRSSRGCMVRTLISTTDIDRFDAEHISLNELATSRDTEAEMMLQRIEAAGIGTVFPPRRSNGLLYRRAEVADL